MAQMPDDPKFIYIRSDQNNIKYYIVSNSYELFEDDENFYMSIIGALNNQKDNVFYHITYKLPFDTSKKMKYNIDMMVLVKENENAVSRTYPTNWNDIEYNSPIADFYLAAIELL